ncbi:MAG TPA: sulfite exporter TauE/SafE family protein [Terriglobia bacterium]
MPIEQKAALLVIAGVVAGVMNSLAGGGTLITFPSLIFVGLPAIGANATNSVALLTGIGSSIWGYRRELATQRKWALRFAPPSLLGGLVGALLLLNTGETQFRFLVPYLILFAALLFTFQGPILRLLEIEAHAIGRSRRGLGVALLFQFGVAVYGGYFGAGIGILMLAALGFLGQTDMHEMNSVKVLQSFLINVVAAVLFIWSGQIYWTECLMIACGSAVGGAVGPHLGRRVGPIAVRAVVSIIGFAIGIYFLLR